MTPTSVLNLARAGRPLRLALLICVLAVALVAAGCGGSSSDESVAALDGSNAAAAADTTSSAEDGSETDDPQQAALEWAACMRKNGVDVPDPEVSSDGRIRIGPGAGGGGIGQIDQETFEKARKECGSPMGRSGGPVLTEAQREEMQATMLKFAACMRKNGVDMPDPQFSGGGGFFRVQSGNGNAGPRPDDPTFRKAQKACESIIQDALPGRDGDGGPSTSTSGSTS